MSKFNTIYKQAKVRSKREDIDVKFYVIHSIGFNTRYIKTEQDCIDLLEDSKAYARKIGQPEFPASAHYCILQDGTRVKYDQDRSKLYHAGTSEWKGYKNLNNYSMGFELTRDDSKQGMDQYSKIQIESLIELLISYNVKSYYITEHRQISPGRKTDPDHFDFEEFIQSYNVEKHMYDNGFKNWEDLF